MIRPARPSDAEAITALEAEAFGAAAWSRAQVEAELAGPTRRVLVAESGDGVIGYAAMALAGDVADLTRIAVAVADRRRGTASDLLQALQEFARQAGAERVLLEVAESNRDARAFYVSHGYGEVSRRRAYYAGAGDALVLARALG